MSTQTVTILILAIIIVIITIVIQTKIKMRSKKNRLMQEYKDRIEGMTNSSKTISPREFLTLRRKTFGRKGSAYYSNKFNNPGVYILHNLTKNMYYVGQGEKVFDYIYMHFTGEGDTNVYADYKYRDEWGIKVILLENSDYESLDELQQDMIAHHDSIESGYNGIENEIQEDVRRDNRRIGREI